MSGTATGTDEDISQLRHEIDELDSKIIELWQRRAALSKQVGQLRLASGGPRLVLSREMVVIRRYTDELGPDGRDVALLVLRAGRGPL
ncbi:chorismate mutase [Phytohabitans kaempferiae]|uniref:Chorismate mutase n=1 Tax=Phytohabitans kaempferiae TaxID=1620943 RepID=A0ABV6MAM7_9ACTN